VGSNPARRANQSKGLQRCKPFSFLGAQLDLASLSFRLGNYEPGSIALAIA
jgi:hypothetical protein